MREDWRLNRTRSGQEGEGSLAGETGKFNRGSFFEDVHYKDRIPTVVKLALAEESGLPYLFQCLDPIADLPVSSRILTALIIIEHMSPSPADDSRRAELQQAALSFVRDLFSHEGTRQTLVSLLFDRPLKLVQSLKSSLARLIPGDSSGQEFLLPWIQFSRDYWLRADSAEAALEYVENLMQAICYEGVDMALLPLPQDPQGDRIPRELLRRRLLAFIHNRDPRWKVTRPQNASNLLGFGELSLQERRFSSFDWRVYDVIYDYSLGLESRVQLRKTAQDLLEVEERGEYEAYAKLFRSDNPMLAVDSAYAFIQATQFRTRKAKGPAEEFRKRADEVIDAVFNDPRTSQGVHMRILEIYRCSGDFIPILEFFEKQFNLSDWKLAGAAFAAAVSCWAQSLFQEEQQSLLGDVIRIFLMVVNGGSDEVHMVMLESIPALTEEPRKALRKELRMLLADVDVEASVRKQALEALGLLGEGARPAKKTYDDFQKLMDDDDEDEPPSPGPAPRTADGSSGAPPELESHEGEPETVPEDYVPGPGIPGAEKLQEFLDSREKLDELKRICAALLREGDQQVRDSYHFLFDARDRVTGNVLFEHILASARVLIELFQGDAAHDPWLKKEGPALEAMAKERLFFLLFYRQCPDLVKLESFELLRNLNYFDINRADTAKRFALAFAKDALIKRSQGPACRGLADLISLRTSPPAINSLEGKGMAEIVEDFTSCLIKEKEPERQERLIMLLHHLSFQDAAALNALSCRLNPLNFKEILAILEGLVKKHNRFAGILIIETVARDFREIRNQAVSVLARVGAFLFADQKPEAIASILGKIDDCYDDDMRKEFLETTLKIDLQAAAGQLLQRCMTLRVHERKEFGDMLFRALERMKASCFIQFCDSDNHLEQIRQFILRGPGDSLGQMYAKRLLGLYRENFIMVFGREKWDELQKSFSDPRRLCIREISRLM